LGDRQFGGKTLGLGRVLLKDDGTDYVSITSRAWSRHRRTTGKVIILNTWKKTMGC